MANAEVAAAEQLVMAAEMELQRAEALKQEVAAQAGSDEERIESVKAGGVAVAGGLLGALPFALASSVGGLSTVLSLGAAAASCLLFGVTYR